MKGALLRLAFDAVPVVAGVVAAIAYGGLHNNEACTWAAFAALASVRAAYLRFQLSGQHDRLKKRVRLTHHAWRLAGRPKEWR